VDRPNLFDYATSKLSQDAFLCWLLAWAHLGHREADGPVHRTAIALLGGLLGLHGIDAPAECSSLEVRRQHKDIDILVLVNDDLAVAVEDKTNTSEHSDQLRRYLDIVKQDFPARRPAPVYLKTGDQSSLKAVEAAGWKCFRRRDLLAVLEHGERLGVASDIFRDFHSRLRRIDEAVAGWRHVPFGKWGRGGCLWTGFFVALQETLGEGNWGHVNNAAGGFMGFWWHWNGDKYLQLEEDRLCFKIMVKEKAEQAARWHAWHRKLMAAGGGSGLKLRRPARRGTGTFMTVAVLDGDYRRADGREPLDLDATVSVLRQAERLLDAAAATA
jgi:hypothetical protein